jgi:protein SCO1/2
MKPSAFLLIAASFITIPLRAQQHHATGVVLTVDKPHSSLVISCDDIPGYMAAMEMPFTVANTKQLTSLHPGTSVQFTIVQRGKLIYAEKIHPTIAANLESEPMQAGSLSTLQNTLAPAHLIAQGQHVPDFELTDQTQHQVKLSDLSGKVVLLTFGYSRCPNPDYCLRLANNLAGVRNRFASRTPRDLTLITIAIDPERDNGATLTQYAAVWKADPTNWHFLTGPLPEIKSVAGMFGMNFWRSEGLLTHSLHTVIIDRSGNLAANLEGNHFTTQQLGDLVQTVMDRH